MPLTDYFDSRTSYSVPEVMGFSTIPFERAHLVKSYRRDSLIDIIREIGGFLPYPLQPPQRANEEKKSATMKLKLA
jgi:hypothetical protein